MVTTNICPQLASTEPSQGLPLFHSYDSPWTNTSTGYLLAPPLDEEEEDDDDDDDDDEEEELPEELPELLLVESREPTAK